MTNAQIWVGYAILGIAVSAHSLWLQRKMFQRDMRTMPFPAAFWPPMLFSIFVMRALTWPYQLLCILWEGE